MKKTLTRILAVVMMATLLLGCVGATAAGKEVKVNKTNFPDAAFRKYVSANLDKNHDGKLTAKEIKGATYIYIPRDSYNVKNLKGIEYLTALQELNIDASGSSKVFKLKSPDLSKNRKLTELTFTQVVVDKLDLTKNTKLTSLGVVECSVSALDLRKNKKLTFLDISDCPKLKTLDLSKNTKLETMFLRWNDGLQSVKLGKMPNLGQFTCIENGNRAMALNVTGCTKLLAAVKTKGRKDGKMVAWTEDEGGSTYFVFDDTVKLYNNGARVRFSVK